MGLVSGEASAAASGRIKDVILRHMWVDGVGDWSSD